ncbi:MAG: metallophosphoesterase [Clostridia bacterium]|nr:metallophosphoesterase [Clostridia bacterium]
MSGLTVAALADIHSNYIAFGRCLEAVKEAGAQVILFLGDCLTDCACPQETMALLRRCMREYDCRFVRGNREQYLIDHRAGKGGWRRGTGGGSLLYTYSRLTEDDLDFLEAMPAVRREVFPGLPAVLCCHGTPDDLRGWMETRPDQAQAWVDEAGAGLLVCAHTHRPRVVRLARGTMVNTGSGGVPTEPGLIQFALLRGEGGVWRPELVSIPYDVEPVIDTFSRDGFLDEAGLWPVMMMKQLREGGEQAIPFVKRAHELWRGEGPVPERAWEQAARETGIL